MEICNKSRTTDENMLDYTYYHESLKHYSYIDFLIFSKSLLCHVDFNIVDSAINMSHHNAILAYIKLIARTIILIIISPIL